MRHQLLASPGLIVALCAGAAADAQSVHGRTLSGHPPVAVSGVIVALVDTSGQSVARTLTNAAGTYRLTAPQAGRYRLKALRIGHRPTLTELLPLIAGTTVERPILLSTEAISLSAVTVTARQQCLASRDSTTAAFTVWEEARKALDAAVLTRRAPYLVEVPRFERRLGADGETIQRESEAERRGPSTRPFTSVPGRELDTAGYVVTDANGSTWSAPDEQVLLSEQFAATHCLRVAEAQADDEVALAFEPIPGRRVPEVSGSITLSRGSGELRRLEFRYVNVPDEVQRAGAGGRLTFRPIPAGGWIVDRWLLRIPLRTRVPSRRPGQLRELGTGLTHSGESVTVGAFLETGGEVTEVSSDGTMVWSTSRPTVFGRVQGDDGAPMAAVQVGLPFLQRSATTDASGRFELHRVRPGRRQVALAWPLTDSLAPDRRPARAFRGRAESSCTT